MVSSDHDGLSDISGNYQLDVRSKIISSAYEAAMQPDGWQQLVDVVCTELNCRNVGIESAHHRSSHCEVILAREFDPTLLAEYTEEHFAINPRVGLAKRMQVGQLVHDRLLGEEIIVSTRSYYDWLERMECPHFAGAKLCDNESSLSCLSAHWERNHDDWAERGADLLQFIAPHIAHAMHMGQVLQRQNFIISAAGTGELDGSTAYLLIDGKGVLCGDFDRNTRSLADIITVVNGRVQARHASDRARFDIFMSYVQPSSDRISPPRAVRLFGDNRVRGVVAKMLPIDGRKSALPWKQPVALITFTDLDQSVTAHSDCLRQTFEFTGREAHIAILLLEGMTVAEIASRLEISNYTVRQHLKSVFAKTGCDRQSELVAVLMRASNNDRMFTSEA